jgi:PadR family transcriptional regulator, regulatory protein PadR
MGGKQKNDILQGTLALLVLRTLNTQGALHGYALTSHIRRISTDLLRVEEGSLYPALHRMEQDGLVRSKWGLTEKGRKARMYSLTAAGERQLAEETKSWARLTQGVALVLESS